MKYEVRITRRAKKNLDKYEKDRERINDALKGLVAYYSGESEKVPDLKKLKGKYQGLLRLRVGELRLIMKIDADKPIFTLIDIVPRSGAYRSK